MGGNTIGQLSREAQYREQRLIAEIVALAGGAP